MAVAAGLRILRLTFAEFRLILGQYAHIVDQSGEDVTSCTAPQNVPSATGWLRRCIGGGYIEEIGR